MYNSTSEQFYSFSNLLDVPEPKGEIVKESTHHPIAGIPMRKRERCEYQHCRYYYGWPRVKESDMPAIIMFHQHSSAVVQKEHRQFESEWRI
mmetsp:Transcript_39536/g.82119  ORF Transcript_39536/g.82119 Transcript_39536/m.82119 type:complete len:92 (-) Transcript_39536:1159-1434(-)